MTRLDGAISPYVRSHAANPVDWYPWGREAFAEARRRDVPVLISIGYATCHWCHVMARESFSDPAIAAVMNEKLVTIKVDREEHPDVDSRYLASASAFTSNLGWPLTVFATPDGRAFFAGTYFPPEPRGGTPSFRQVLDAVDDAWTERRDEVEQAATAVSDAVDAVRPDTGGTRVGADLIDNAARRLAGAEDPRFGGFGTAPKFPVAPALIFLEQHGGESAVVAERIARKMGSSALRDPVEGGFFRYATEPDWTHPHFERMLYDNALLLDLYTRIHARTGSTWSATVARGIARFLIDVLRLPDGTFASGQDSESVIDGRRTEGGYYALDLEARSLVDAPALDDKTLTGWNGLAIGALARASTVLGDADYLDAAREAADVLLARDADRALARVSRGADRSEAAATLEDYGMLAGALLALGLAAGDPRYLVEGRRLIDEVLTADGFRPPGGGDAVLVEHGHAREADPSEGAYPSEISACSDAALDLFALTGVDAYRQAAEGALSRVSALALAQPLSFGSALTALERLDGALVQIVVVVPDDADTADTRAAALIGRARSLPSSVTAVVTERAAAELAESGFELFAGRGVRGSRATAYVCRDFVCRLPVTDADALDGGV
ncbi:thioredoxin domain-containing protein [Agromyces atrinae]|uniref:Thioredoxin domain-containing protein n=1 Tax=Agromyces atrinae TaxID=592376 RepID=A0A4V1R244_9MICO|nr:thioredoxin domain-containing protein [Agromyces atrinae]NYD68754.1 hypothetical protein [Agromyces atrinae]RXZ85053.1 thioredoxin domain-containing protein [Agromyces atrinae]RXZ85866.1 thioredoxin domain-containing protein [Agromyces atrinae]